jgi:hypothetical protein
MGISCNFSEIRIKDVDHYKTQNILEIGVIISIFLHTLAEKGSGALIKAISQKDLMSMRTKLQHLIHDMAKNEGFQDQLFKKY